MTYGSRLKTAITQAKCGRKDLAVAIGISVQAIGDVINGKSNALTAENSAKAAAFLKVSSSWLATGEGEMLASDPSNVAPAHTPAPDAAPSAITTLAQALEVVESKLSELSPLVAGAGRDALAKWARGEEFPKVTAAVLEALSKASSQLPASPMAVAETPVKLHKNET